MKNFLFLILLVSVGVGCHRKADIGATKLTQVDLTQSDEDFVIPATLWKTFEDDYPELTEIAVAINNKEKKEEGKEEKKEEKEKENKKDKKAVARSEEDDALFKRRPSVDPLLFSAQLLEKTKGVLSDSGYDLEFGHGGGAVDLKDYLPEKKNGTFFLKVKYQEEMDPKLTKIFYLSNSKASGCNKYFEITKYWQGIMKDDGLVLNTVDLRHIKISAGTFFFVSPFKGKLRLGHLSIKDSRHPELLCQVNAKY